MLHEFNYVIQTAAATLVGLVCILFVKHSKRGQHIWTGIGFAFCILCYVVIESEAVQSIPILRIIILTGAIIAPVLFWLLARAIFDDHFKLTPGIVGWLSLKVAPHIRLYGRKSIEWPTPFEQLSHVAPGMISIGFVLAGLYSALSTKQSDLVDARLKFRNEFILITALLIGLTVIFEVSSIDRETAEVLQVLQRTSIFTLTLFFLINNFDIRSGFFFKEIPKPKSQTADDPVLNEKFKSFMEVQKVYKKEGLTIRELATLMNEQEYKLRRFINGQLGFRNFSDFLNQYRINDACEVLSDPAQARKTILEIGYDLGYQSIGPFNKAFKDLKGLTPSAYRKSRINC